MTYAEWLGRPVKTQPIYVIEFAAAAITERFTTKVFAGLTSAAEPYARIREALHHKVKILKAQADAGKAAFVLIDTNQEVTAFLNAHDKRLSDTLVRIKLVPEDLTEAADAQTALWFLKDYSFDEKRAEWMFNVLDVFRTLDKPVYEDVKKTHLKLAARVEHTTTEIQLVESPNGWREPGFVLLHDGNRNVELVEYQEIDPFTNKLKNLTRRKHGTGGSIFEIEDSEAIHVWVKRGTPKQIFLEWVLTTDDGSNGGPYDLANGDGAGMPIEAVDVTTIENAFDDTAHGVDDWDFLFIDEKSFDAKEFLEIQILLACSFTESITDEGKLTVVPFENTPSTTTDLEGLFNNRGSFGWRRLFTTRINNIQLTMDHNVGDDSFISTKTLAVVQSILRYSKGSLFKDMEFQGMRGADGRQFGLPDLGGDGFAVTAMVRLAEIYGSPPISLRLETAMRFRDVVPGEGVKITHSAIPNPPVSATRGVIDQIITVLSKRINPFAKRWPVKFDGEIRGNIGRQYRWHSDGATADYDSASDAEKAAGAYWSDDTTLEPGSDEHLGYYWAHDEAA